MKKIVFALTLASLIIGLCSIPVIGLDGYEYSSKITVVNDTGSDITSRIAFETNPATLISSLYIQPDADDVALSDSGVEANMLALDLGSDGVDWYTQFMTIPANSSQVYYSWFGDSSATRDQSWISGNEDVVTATDDATLDITTNLTVESDVYLDDLPAAEQLIVYKPDNYAMTVDSTNFNFYGFTAAYSTETLRPNASGQSNENDTDAGAGDANNYQHVDEAVVNDADYIINSVNTDKTDLYNLDNTALGATDFIRSITVTFRCNSSTAPTGEATPVFYINGTEYEGTTINPAVLLTTYTETFIYNPDTEGLWAHSDLNALQAGVTLKAAAGESVKCTWFYITVNYLPAANYVESSIVATTDVWVSLEGTYDGANVEITDGTNTDANALIAALNTSAEDLIVARFDGFLDSAIIDKNGTEGLNVEFEPDEIDATTITDNSVSGNDLTYSLEAMDANLTVTVEAMTPEETIMPQLESSLYSEAGGILNQPDNFTISEEDAEGGNAGNIPSAFIDPLADVSDVDVQWIWWFGFGLLNILLFIAMMKTTGQHLLFGWMTVLVITSAFIAWGPIPWWFIIFYVIGAISTLTMERNPSV